MHTTSPARRLRILPGLLLFLAHASLTASQAGPDLPLPTQPPGPAGFQIRTNDHRVEFLQNNSLLLGYQAEPGTLPRPDIKPLYRRGGYLFPILTPEGKAVVDDFPPKHIHHHGLWFSWTKTQFQGRQPDFWNMGDAKGLVEFVSLDTVWNGPIHAGLRAHHRYVDLTSGKPVPVLEETWVLTVLGHRPTTGNRKVTVLDLAVAQTPSGPDALHLDTYRYGGIGFRGPREWDGPKGATILTSTGESDRIKAHATRAKWIAMTGATANSTAGLAILAHPSNLQFPEPMRVHPDEPFLNFAPCQAADFEIKPGTTHEVHYRFVAFDGPADPATLDALWNDFTLTLLPKPAH